MLLQCLQEAICSTNERGVSRYKLPGLAVRKGDRGPTKVGRLVFFFFCLLWKAHYL